MSRILILLIVFSAVSYFVSAQTAEVVSAQDQVNRIIEDSSKHFREGMVAFSQFRRVEAGEKFDDAVEVFLSSTLNIQNNQRLQTCYTQLIETFYLLEFPSGNQIPQLRALPAICGWRWSETDFLIADKVVAMTAQTNKKPVDPKAVPASVPPTSETFAGFDSQEFTPIIGDELARIELSQDEPISSSSHGRPIASSVKVVKAQSGDTVSKLAMRHGADPVEVAKLNGLLVNSLLGSGREIRISADGTSSQTYEGIRYATKRDLGSLAKPTATVPSSVPIGPRPVTSRGGSVPIVVRWFNEFLHDPFSMRIARWSPIFRTTYAGIPVWAVQVKYRAKNLMGAYGLSERTFYIRNGKIVGTFDPDK